MRSKSRYLAVVLIGILAVTAIGPVTATSHGCFFVTTQDADGDDASTLVYLESTDSDTTATGFTSDDSSCNRDDSYENSFESYIFNVPSGEYNMRVIDEDTNEFWGEYEVYVSEEGISSNNVWTGDRGFVYSTDSSISSPRDTTQFQPGEAATLQLDVYNGQPSGSNGINVNVYIHDSDKSPSTATETFTYDVSAQQSDTVTPEFTVPYSEGEYEVSVEIQTEGNSGYLLSDEFTAETISVESFEPPEIDSSDPRDTDIQVPEDDSRRFSVTTSDPDSSDSSLTHTWYVDNQEITTGESFTFRPDDYGSGEHTVDVVVSDGTSETADTSESWTVEVIEAPRIKSVSPGNTEVDIGSEVTFSAYVTAPGGYSPLQYEWTIDGQTFQGEEVSQTLTSSGEVTAEIEVTNSQGLTATQSFSVDVESIPPQVGEIRGTGSEITPGESITVSATASDPDNRNTDFDYEWTILGDTYRGSTLTVSPTEIGQHDIELTVTNGYGTSTTRTESITVVNDKPTMTAADTSSRSITAGQSERFAFSVSDADASDTQLELIVNGETVKEKQISQATAEDSFSYQFSTPGAYTVEVVAADGNGASTKVSWDVSVASRPPEFTDREPEQSSLSTQTGSAIDFSVSTSDPDGQRVSSQWYVNGDSAGSGQEFTQQFDENGQYSIRAVVTDPGGKSRDQTWDVVVSSFNEPLIIDDQVSAITLTPNGSAEFATVSVSNPAVNDRTAEVEVILEIPDGLSVNSARNVESGNPSQFLVSDSLAPGRSTSMSLNLQLTDESQLGQTVNVDYSVIYYPKGQRADSTELTTQTKEIALGDQPTTENANGFTAVTGIVSAFLFVYLFIGRRTAE